MGAEGSKQRKQLKLQDRDGDEHSLVKEQKEGHGGWSMVSMGRALKDEAAKMVKIRSHRSLKGIVRIFL